MEVGIPSSDSLDRVPVAPDTEAAKWEAAYCIARANNLRLHEGRARLLQAISLAVGTLTHFTDGKGGEEAFLAIQKIQELIRQS